MKKLAIVFTTLISLFMFSNDAKAQDYFDNLKKITVGDVELSFGAQWRARGEYVTNFAATDGADDEFLLLRQFLFLNGTYKDLLGFTLQSKNATVSGRQDLPKGNDHPLLSDEQDVQKAYLDLYLLEKALTFRAGRMEHTYGNQRLLSHLPWSNTLHSYDGLKVLYKQENYKIDAWATYKVAIDKHQFNEPTEELILAGIYYNHKYNEYANWDAYLLLKEVEDVQSRYTIGARAYGKLGMDNLTYDLELAYQTGSYDQAAGDLDIAAYMVSLEVKYAFADVSWKPAIQIGFDIASGGGDADTDEGFDQLYPLGHKYFGQADLVARKNITAFHLKFFAKPIEKFSTLVQFHFFQKTEDDDAYYGLGFAKAANGESDIGIEIDFKVKYQYNSYWSTELGYSHFVADDSIGEDVDYVYLQTMFKF